MTVAMDSRKQFIRYAVVGLVSNVSGYLLYLFATSFGVGPKVAMTYLYLLGVLQTFVLNKRWSFRFAGAATPALVRYAAAYALGYAINFLVLMLLVDKVGWPHQPVQGVMILAVAALLFLVQRHWVFRRAARSDAA